MGSRLQAAKVRALPLLALAATLAILVSLSSLRAMLPIGWSPALTGYAAFALALALLPAAFASRSPLPATLAVVVPVLAVASYDQSRLDWLRLLKDFGVAAPGMPSWGRLALAMLALLLAWTAHALDYAWRLRRGAEERGVVPAQARAAMRLSLRRTSALAGGAVAGTVVLGALALLAQPLDLGTLLAGRAALIAPLAAVILLALAAILVAGGRGSDPR